MKDWKHKRNCWHEKERKCSTRMLKLNLYIDSYLTKKTSTFRGSLCCTSLDAFSGTVVMGTEQRHVGAVRPRGFDSRGGHAHTSC